LFVDFDDRSIGISVGLDDDDDIIWRFLLDHKVEEIGE
jgi:hypothetical protein